MSYMYRNSDKIYRDIEELIEEEDLYSLISLEQQRSFLLEADEVYDEDNYDDINCEYCNGKCVDVFYTEDIKELKGLDFCDLECMASYIDKYINDIEDIDKIQRRELQQMKESKEILEESY